SRARAATGAGDRSAPTRAGAAVSSRRLDEVRVANREHAVRAADDLPAVRRHHERRAMAPADVVEQREHALGGLEVEIAGRLVREDELRLVRDRPGDRDPLLLAARKLLRKPLAAAGEAEVIEEPGDPRPGRCL